MVENAVSRWEPDKNSRSTGSISKPSRGDEGQSVPIRNGHTSVSDHIVSLPLVQNSVLACIYSDRISTRICLSVRELSPGDTALRALLSKACDRKAPVSINYAKPSSAGGSQTAILCWRRYSVGPGNGMEMSPFRPVFCFRLLCG